MCSSMLWKIFDMIFLGLESIAEGAAGLGEHRRLGFVHEGGIHVLDLEEFAGDGRFQVLDGGLYLRGFKVA